MENENTKQFENYSVTVFDKLTKRAYYGIKSVELSQNNQEQFFDNAFSFFVSSFSLDGKIIEKDKWQETLNGLDFQLYDKIMAYILEKITAKTEKKTA